MSNKKTAIMAVTATLIITGLSLASLHNQTKLQQNIEKLQAEVTAQKAKNNELYAGIEKTNAETKSSIEKMQAINNDYAHALQDFKQEVAVINQKEQHAEKAWLKSQEARKANDTESAFSECDLCKLPAVEKCSFTNILHTLAKSDFFQLSAIGKGSFWQCLYGTGDMQRSQIITFAKCASANGFHSFRQMEHVEPRVVKRPFSNASYGIRQCQGISKEAHLKGRITDGFHALFHDNLP